MPAGDGHYPALSTCLFFCNNNEKFFVVLNFVKIENFIKARFSLSNKLKKETVNTYDKKYCIKMFLSYF